MYSVCGQKFATMLLFRSYMRYEMCEVVAETCINREESSFPRPEMDWLAYRNKERARRGVLIR
jgi:hypothetical protein